MIPLGSQILFCVDSRLLGLVISNDLKFCLRIGVVSELVPYPTWTPIQSMDNNKSKPESKIMKIF